MGSAMDRVRNAQVHTSAARRKRHSERLCEADAVAQSAPDQRQEQRLVHEERVHRRVRRQEREGRGEAQRRDLLLHHQAGEAIKEEGIDARERRRHEVHEDDALFGDADDREEKELIEIGIRAPHRPRLEEVPRVVEVPVRVRIQVLHRAAVKEDERDPEQRARDERALPEPLGRQESAQRRAGGCRRGYGLRLRGRGLPLQGGLVIRHRIGLRHGLGGGRRFFFRGRGGLSAIHRPPSSTSRRRAG
jgi:hypothetical protein